MCVLKSKKGIDRLFGGGGGKKYQVWLPLFLNFFFNLHNKKSKSLSRKVGNFLYIYIESEK